MIEALAPHPTTAPAWNGACALVVGAVPARATASGQVQRTTIVAVLVAVALLALVAATLLRRRESERRPAGGSTGPVTLVPDETMQSLAGIGETVLIYMLRFGADGRLVGHCAASPKLFGPVLEALRSNGKALLDLVHPDDRATYEAAFAARTSTTGRGVREPFDIQYRIRATDGSWRWLHERVRPATTASGQGDASWESVIVDFTERRAGEDRQQYLLDLQRLATRVLETFLRSDDLDRGIESMLGAAGSALQLSRVSFVRLDADVREATVVREWVAPGFPSARTRRQVQQLDKTGWWVPNAKLGKPSVFRREDAGLGLIAVARSIHEEVLAMLVVPVLVHGTLRAALVFEDLVAARRFRREEISTAQTLAFAVVRGMERQETSAERRRVEGLQRTLERSELVAQLAGGIAHDFNNVLFAVRGQIQILRKRVSDEETLEALSRIESAIAGASEMVTGIRRAHRGEEEPLLPTALVPALEDACRLVARLLPDSIALERELGTDESAHVLSSPQRIQQLVLNLALNARDAIATDVRGRIRVRVRRAPDGPRGPMAIVEVDDTGPGIPPPLREQALKPFFTTKAGRGAGSGTGMGLSICQRVAKEAGGTLTLDSSSDLGGLRVLVSFPIVPAAPEAAADADPASFADAVHDAADRDREVDNAETDDSALQEGSDGAFAQIGCALVVEDDPAVRRILAHSLAASDVEVLERTVADDLDAYIRESPMTIDLIVMDVDLPGTSGMEAARRLRAAGCAIPIVFVTGGTAEFDPSLAPATLLRKPFPIEALPRAVAKLMARP
ncbi:MAG: response regulator [Phycisphaerae bacterium]|nr:response regulator [Phycisphaerae bacterium]